MDEGVGEATSVVGLRMVSMMRICGRGRGVRSYSGRLDGVRGSGYEAVDL